jgi:hypothetical protein
VHCSLPWIGFHCELLLNYRSNFLIFYSFEKSRVKPGFCKFLVSFISVSLYFLYLSDVYFLFKNVRPFCCLLGLRCTVFQRRYVDFIATQLYVSDMLLNGTHSIH